MKYQGSTTLGCKYIRSTTLGCKYLRNRKSKFVAKTQFIYKLQKSTNIWILLSAYTNVKLYSVLYSVLYNEINLSKFLISFSVRTAQLNLKLTRLYKDDFLSQINRFLDSNSSINHGDFWGSRESVSNHQMFKISYILKTDNSKII